jgi:Mn2+/Fe2+ NRAMP family transporter
MKRLLEVALGIVTGIGGFLEAGSLATSVQAGAAFDFKLGWAVLLGAACLAFLAEMSGRFAAVSKRTITGAIRERFGFPFFLIPLVTSLVVMLLVLTAEIGGVAMALQLASGIGLAWWALPVALGTWLILWRGSFGVIEQGVSLLGLVTLAFVVAAVKLHPPLAEIGHGLVPSLPRKQPTQYWYLAVSILGASVSPYLFFFYSSGAIEDHWDTSHLTINRITAGLGMGFGGIVALAALVLAAVLFHPAGVRVERYEQIAQLLPAVLGHWGSVLFVLSLGIACLGAALELALTMAYVMGQGFGWEWSKNQRPIENARFSIVYTIAVLLAALPIAAGADLLKVTTLSMALTAAMLPLAITPFLLLMNDKRYLPEHRNGVLSNAVVFLITILGAALAVVSLPLQILGGGS